MKSNAVLQTDLPIDARDPLRDAASADAQFSDADLTALVAELFAQHATAIRVYIGALTRDGELADDLMQETYLQLHQTRIRLRDVSNRRAWIYRIATHVTLNELKRRRRFAWLPWHAAQDDARLSWVDPETLIHRRDAVERALAELPPPYRAPLLMYSSDGLSVSEVALALGINEGAVKTRLHRAREKFRVAYEREMED